MKKILSIFIIIATVSILLISNNTIAGPAWFAPSGVKTSTECNAAAYYADGTLCQDTDDNKLYLGTGAAVLEILSTTTGYALDAELSALAGLTSAANAIPYFTGSGTAGVISSSADMVSLLGSADYATARTNLGLGTLATQNADNASVTNLTVGGAANVTGRVTINGIQEGWAQVTAFTATPASTSTLTMTSDMTGQIQAGQPLKYVISSTTYYGIVSAISSNLLTINGAPLSGDVTALYVGTPDKVTQMVINVPSTYEDDSCTTLVATDLKINIVWQKAKSYLVKYTAWSLVHDTGTDGQVSVRINGTEVNTTAGGLTIAADATLYSTVVDIATAAYDINNGETIEITSVKGGNGDATDLTMTLIFVTP